MKDAGPMQDGGSQRGTYPLDEGRRRRGFHEADVTIDSPEDHPLSAGGAEGAERRRAVGLVSDEHDGGQGRGNRSIEGEQGEGEEASDHEIDSPTRDRPDR
jgi:hypothetical protein